MDGPAEYFNPWKQFTGAFLPRWLLERRELTLGAKLAYAQLASYAGARGVAWPSQTRLARDLGVTDRQFRNYLRELTDTGLIHVTHRGTTSGRRGQTAVYRFLSHWWMPVHPRTARKSISGQSTSDRQAISGQSHAHLNGRARAVLEIHTQERSTAARKTGRAAPAGRSLRDQDKPKGRGHQQAQELIATLAAAKSINRRTP